MTTDPTTTTAPQPKKSKWIIIAVGALIILLLVFGVGVFIGTRKAEFSYRWGENYHMMFGGPRGGFLQDFAGQDDFIPGNGTAGTVLKINGNQLIVKSTDGVEKTIKTTDQTTIRKGGSDIKISDIKADNQIVVIGSPNNDGTIEAKFIRVFDPSARPPMPTMQFPFPKF